MYMTNNLETLFNQAPKTVREFFDYTCGMLDETFGKGYAAENPSLVGQLTHSMTVELATGVFAVKVDGLSYAINDLTSSTS